MANVIKPLGGPAMPGGGVEDTENLLVGSTMTQDGPVSLDSLTIKAAQSRLTFIPYPGVPFNAHAGTSDPNSATAWKGSSADYAKEWGMHLEAGADPDKPDAASVTPYNDTFYNKTSRASIATFKDLTGAPDKIREELFSRFTDGRYGDAVGYHLIQDAMPDLQGITFWNPMYHRAVNIVPQTVIPPDLIIPGVTMLLEDWLVPGAYLKQVGDIWEYATNAFGAAAFEQKLWFRKLAPANASEINQLILDYTGAGSSFFDAVFSIYKTAGEVAYMSAEGESLGLSDPVRIQPNYNFYLQPYEKIIKEAKHQDQTLVPEVIIPNLYALMIDVKNTNESDTYENKFEHALQWQYHSTDENQYKKAISDPVSAAQLLATQAWKVAPAVQTETFNEYLNNFAKALKKAAAKPTGWNSLNFPEPTDYTTSGISAYKIKDYMDEADRIKKFFPMHVDIEVPAANGGKIGKILYEASLFDQFMQLTMAAMYPRGFNKGIAPDFYSPTAVIKRDFSFNDNPSTAGIDVQAKKDSIYEESLINLWLNPILSEQSMPDLDTFKWDEPSGPLWDYGITDSEALAYVQKLNSQTKSGFLRPIIFGKKKTSSAKFITNLKWGAARKKINNFIRQKVRSVSDIYDAKEAYSEVLFYEIVKFRRTADAKLGGTFVQNIFLPNTPQMAVLKYIDTQIKYDADYYYQVYAHTIVVGTQYQYNQNMQTAGKSADEPSPSSIINYHYAPSVFLMRVPYYNTYVTMQSPYEPPITTFDHDPILSMDPVTGQVTPLQLPWGPAPPNGKNLEETPIVSHPPVFPDATFIPLYGERNKILLNANLNVGEYDLVPEFINAGEKDTIKRIRRNQRKIQDGSKITFKEDDFCGQIEILRIEKRPLSWADFAPTENFLVGYAGGSANFGQIIEQKPNKDYYYTVRAKDVHQYYSNPSPVYQVRIVARDGEAPYTIVNMFFIDEVVEKKTVAKKDLMKYIRIQPAFKQSYLDDKSITEDHDSVTDFAMAAKSIEGPHLDDFVGDQTNPPSKTVFGREFKFRFTSKKTGRKFDLNLFIDNPYITSGTGQSTKGETDKYSSGKC